MTEYGKLFLIPTPLGDAATHTIPPYVVEVAHTLHELIAERAKTARQFLKSIDTPVPMTDLLIHELNEHTDKEVLKTYLDGALQGKNIGLLSEAGCPAVADPGAVIVAMAHRLGIEVVPLVGPSSILLALMASGMNGQNFAFVGYLPAKTPDRIKAIRQVEAQSGRMRQTQIFIETPYRNEAMLADLLKNLAPSTRLCVAMNLTLPTQQILTRTVAEWRTAPDKTAWTSRAPAIFLIDVY